METTQLRRQRLWMFALLYFVQGSVLAYFQNFQKPYLTGLKIDADVIGALAGILVLPFVLKIFIGILSDRVNLLGLGHRKPYILLGMLLAAAAFAGAGFVPPERSFILFAALIVAGSFSIATFDAAADGLALDTTPASEHGQVQGVMVGGKSLGFILLSLVFGLMVQALGYPALYAFTAISMLVPLPWVLRVREAPGRAGRPAFEWRAFAALARPAFLVFAVYAILYSIVSFGVDGLVTLYMSQGLGLPDSTLGVYGALRGLGAAAGALVGGLLFDRVRRTAGAYAAILLITATAILIGLSTSTPLMLGIGVLWGAAWGFQETVFIALAMDLADARIAASMFAIMMALSNVGTALGEAVATGLTDNLTYSAVFWLLAGFNLLVIPILWFLFKMAPQVSSSQSQRAVTTA